MFVDIAPNAVPLTKDDRFYAPIVAAARDGDGSLVGAALTCRSQLAAGTVAVGGQLGDPMNLRPVLDKHSELDLISVEPSVRMGGVATDLLGYLERALISGSSQLGV